MFYSCIKQFLCCVFSSKPKTQLLFSQIDIDGTIVGGNIKMVKLELGQTTTFTAEPLDRKGKPAKIEDGSAEFTFVGTDIDGNDVSDTVTLEVDAANELSVKVTVGDTELTGTLTLRADGDPDAGEDAPLIGTADIVVDASNAVTFTLTNTEPTDVAEAAPEPTPEPTA